MAENPKKKLTYTEEDEITTPGEQTTREVQDTDQDISELKAGVANLQLGVKDRKKNPWENAKPDARKQLEENVSDSAKYKGFVKLRYKHGQEVSMSKIIKDLPRFIAESGNQSSKRCDDHYEAQSIKETIDYTHSTYYVDCEYIFTIHIPDDMKEYFKANEARKEVCGVQKDGYRWIFVPSYLRAKCGLFDWSKTEVNLAKTLRVIVVRPSQFNEYREQVGKNSNLHVAVLSLPEEGNGIGYSRYWIQRIAEHLKLDWVWMIDDSVLWFRDGESAEKRCSFEVVFREIEKLAKDNDLAAVGPRVYNGRTVGKVTNPFMYKPPRGVVLLNLQKIRANLKRVHYRPELVILEDMVFGHECEKAGLKVCVCNRFLFCDMKWNETGTSASIGTPTHVTPIRGNGTRVTALTEVTAVQGNPTQSTPT